MIVDGQQRLTSLYTVLTGKEVLRDDYTASRIRIAFRPGTAALKWPMPPWQRTRIHPRYLDSLGRR